MSGKAPPTGPRALLGTQAGSSGSNLQSSSSLVGAHHANLTPKPTGGVPQPPRPSQPAAALYPGSRIGATPPTGPRSLQTNNHARAPPGPKQLLNGHSHLSNSGGTNAQGLQSNRYPISIKGKKRDEGVGGRAGSSWQPSYSQGSLWPEPNGNGTANGFTSSSGSAFMASVSPPSPPPQPLPTVHNGELKQDRPSVHIAIQHRVVPGRPEQPPPPPNEPPPPPTEPPPPPPSTQPPPPPPPPPSIQPPPPSTQPPPPPPPSIQPPPPPSIQLPPPPSTQPPPSPPPPPPSTDLEVRRASPPPPPPSLPPLKSYLGPPPPPEESHPPPPPPPQISSPSPPPPPPLPPTWSPPPLPPLVPSSASLLPSLSAAEKPLPRPSPPLYHRPPSPPPSQFFGSLSPTIQPPPPPPPHPSTSNPPRNLSLPRRPSSPLSWNSRSHSREPSPRRHRSAYAHPRPISPIRAVSPRPSPVQAPLPPRPTWPPLKSEFAPHRTFKLLYDPATDSPTSVASTSALASSVIPYLPLGTYPNTRPPSYYRQLIEHVRKYTVSTPAVMQDRIKGKGKGKEMLYRMEGETVDEQDDGFREDKPVIRDPRKDKNVRRPAIVRSGKNDFVLVKYQYDENSTGPAPPSALLITNISPLTPNTALRRHFSEYGALLAFEPQIDKENGSALGVLYIKYPTHDEARRCMEKEDGRKDGLMRTAGLSISMPTTKSGEKEEWRVVFDGEGLKLKAVLKEIEERKRKDREEKRRGPVVPMSNGVGVGGGSTGATPASREKDRDASSGTPYSGMQSPAPRKGPIQGPHQHPHPHAHPSSAGSHAQPKSMPPSQRTQINSTLSSNLPPKPSSEVVKAQEPEPAPKIIDALEKARAEARERNRRASAKTSSVTAGGVGGMGGRGRTLVKYNAYQASPMNISRSPSPATAAGGGTGRNMIMNTGGAGGAGSGANRSAAEKEKDRMEVVRLLAENGNDHVKVQGGVQLVASVKDEDVRAFFDGFVIDKILRDHTGLYATFLKAGVAHRATALLGSKQLGFQSVTLTVHPPPVYEPVVEKTHWDAVELVADAQKMILRELRALLGKDIADRLVAQDLKKLVVERSKGASTSATQKELARPMEKKGLKGLSFKKKVQEVVEQKEDVDEMDVEEKEEAEVEAEIEPADEDEDEEGADRPKKKRKVEAVKIQRRVINDEDIESEDEDESDVARVAAINANIAARKRAVSENREDEDEPVKKKHKLHDKEVVTGKGKRAKKTKGKKGTAKHNEAVEEILLTDTERFASPAVTKLRLDTTFDGSSATSSRSPSPQPKRKRRPPTPPLPPSPSPPPDPLELGLCEDDEDLYFAKLALAGEVPNDEKPSAPPSSSDIPTFRKHLTGSARTEGYYKITHAEKAAYVAQYQARAATAGAAPPIIDEAPVQHVTSSRSNRANARRRAQGLEEINQVQRAVALSKGETAASELTFKFNQLQTRKKHLRFARSPIHDWGLYAMEKISRGEMVIEYVGEVIRAQVADKREKAYERQGIGSSYLFRIDEDLVVDATKKGNLGRLINHSCDPNCTAKIITISGEKKIVIYAKQDIELGDEITYDYHFPFEQDKIPCLCGSAKCRGFLN